MQESHLTLFGLVAAIVAPGLTALIAYPFLLRMIAPYQAWSKRHDLVFVSVAIVIVAAVLWLHGDLVAQFF